MTLGSRLRERVLACQLGIGAAYKAIARAEKEAAKNKQPVPRHILDKLNEAVAQARLECYSAEASLAGASKYPPLT